jgi:glutamate decarboxylase
MRVFCRFTYEIAPVFVLMEEVTLQKMRKDVGWPDGEGDGIFAPGGSIANLYAVLLARHKYWPDVKQKGLQSLPALVIFTSEQAHFSIKKAAAVTGIGTDNVITVKCSYK